MATIRGFRGAAAAAAIVLASCHGTDATYTIGGDVTGSTGPFVLKLNGGNDISMPGDGSFKFDKKLLKDETFNVQIVDDTDDCTVANGAGTVGMSNVTDVVITCAAQALQTVIRSANLSGSQENPAVATSASGAGGVIVIPSTTLPMPITGGITFSGVAPAPGQVNIHLAPAGNPTGNGPAIVALTLAADGVTAIVPPGTTLNSVLLGPLLRGELYFNVATAANPSGQIRGPIELQGGVAASVALLDNTQVVPPTTSTATGTGTIFVDRATRKILITYITHNVSGATVADIHTSAGLGSPVVPFTNLQSGLATPAAGAVMTVQNLTDFDNSLLYFNVGSPTHLTGEIRGNISPQ